MITPEAKPSFVQRSRSALQFYVPPLLVFLALLLILAVALNPLLDLINTLIDPLLDPLAQIGISEPVLQTMLVSAILALSIYITLYGGMFSLANAGFMGIGAYAGAIMTKNFDGSFGSALLVGMLVAGMMSLLVSLPVLRLRNIYLAIATIGFGEIVVVFFNRIDAVLLDLYRNNPQLSGVIGDLYEVLHVEVHTTSSGTPTKALITGGASGLKNIPQHTEIAHLILFLIGTAYVMYQLRRSRFGRALDAIRQDEKVAASQGINVVYYKNLAFLIGALIAGAAGVFDAHRDTLIEPKDYGFSTAVDILAYAVLGGTQSWVGPVLGGLTLQGLPELLRELREYSGVITGLTLLIIIVYLPGGLSSLFSRAFWTAGGRYRLAQRVSVAGVVVILLANVLPYQRTDSVAGRWLGNAFWRHEAESVPLVLLGLALALLGAWAWSLYRSAGQFALPDGARQPLLTGVIGLITLFVFYRSAWYLLVGNLLPIIMLFWVLHTPRRAAGGMFAPGLAAIAGNAWWMGAAAGLLGIIEGVLLGYYLQVLGLLILVAGCAIRYEAEVVEPLPAS